MRIGSDRRAAGSRGRAKPREADRRREKRPGRGSGQVRIIGGRWRSRRIAVADRPGLRPSPDALRETLFNWLIGGLDRPVLDAFAGSGALGLEAASRGAPRVVMIERDAVAHATLVKNLTALQGMGTEGKAEGVAELLWDDALRWPLTSDASAWARRYGAFGGVLLDPPFGGVWLARWLAIWPEAVARGVIAPDAWCYTEREAAAERIGPPGYEATREKRFGDTVGTLWWPAGGGR